MQVHQSRRRVELVNSMHVPEHISATGLPLHNGGTIDPRRFAERERIMEMMSVPDRIVLTGGEGYKYTSEPRDVSSSRKPGYYETKEIAELPERLTIAHEGTHVTEPSLMEDHRSQSSIAIDENPLQELKVMRRQLGRLSTRLYQLEDEVEKRNHRDKQFMLTTLVGFAAALVMFMIRR